MLHKPVNAIRIKRIRVCLLDSATPFCYTGGGRGWVFGVHASGVHVGAALVRNETSGIVPTIRGRNRGICALGVHVGTILVKDGMLGSCLIHIGGDDEGRLRLCVWHSFHNIIRSVYLLGITNGICARRFPVFLDSCVCSRFPTVFQKIIIIKHILDSPNVIHIAHGCVC